MFAYLHLSAHFSDFTKQAEWISDILYKHNFETQKLPIHNALMEYLKCRESIAIKLLKYENQTRSITGWMKSFVPGTASFHARKEIGKDLLITKQLYLKITAGYCAHIQHLYKFKDASSHKKILKSPEFKGMPPKTSFAPMLACGARPAKENMIALRKR